MLMESLVLASLKHKLVLFCVSSNKGLNTLSKMEKCHCLGVKVWVNLGKLSSKMSKALTGQTQS